MILNYFESCNKIISAWRWQNEHETETSVREMKELKQEYDTGHIFYENIYVEQLRRKLCNIIQFKKFKRRTKLALHDAPDTGQIELQTRTYLDRKRRKNEFT